jgi:NADH:ubiquinone oxidoreductase subunit 4 (subunit M)
MQQADLKSLIAYSSVAHLSIVIGGIITLLLGGLQIFCFNGGSWFVFSIVKELCTNYANYTMFDDEISFIVIYTTGRKEQKEQNSVDHQ